MKCSNYSKRRKFFQFFGDLSHSAQLNKVKFIYKLLYKPMYKFLKEIQIEMFLSMVTKKLFLLWYLENKKCELELIIPNLYKGSQSFSKCKTLY